MHARRLLLAVATLVLTGAVVAACKGGGDDDRFNSEPKAEPIAEIKEHGLLLVRGQQLLLRDMADGREFLIKQTENAERYYTYPRWSPDGTHIAYVYNVQFTGAPNADWGSDVFVARPDGSEERAVFTHPQPGTTVEGIAWSHDGTSLYLSLLNTSIKDGRFLGQTQTLERLDLASGARTKVVDGGAQPDVARDDSRITYLTHATGFENGGLWTARPDGTEAQLLVPLADQMPMLLYPRFSPDGSQIAFAAVTTASGAEPRPEQRNTIRWPWQVRPAEAHGLPMDIWTVAVGGGTPEQLTRFAEDEPCPAWSPDGAELAIMATGGLYRMQATGGEPQKIAPGAFGGQIDWR